MGAPTFFANGRKAQGTITFEEALNRASLLS
jgi:hypothetical protein